VGTIVLADTTELTTVKISELSKMTSMGEDDVVPGVKDNETQQIKKSNLLRFLESEYEELSNWLDDVTLGDDGLTSVPEMVLTPRASALSDVVGGVYFSSLDKSVYVCTEI
jgi:hypothetical protein